MAALKKFKRNPEVHELCKRLSVLLDVCILKEPSIATVAAREEVRQIAKELNAKHGMTERQLLNVAHAVCGSDDRKISVVACAWDGIGGWYR